MCEKDEILLKIKISPKSSPRSRDGLGDMKLSESETFNDGLARSGVWWGGTSKAAKQCIAYCTGLSPGFLTG